MSTLQGVEIELRTVNRNHIGVVVHISGASTVEGLHDMMNKRKVQYREYLHFTEVSTVHAYISTCIHTYAYTITYIYA